MAVGLPIGWGSPLSWPVGVRPELVAGSAVRFTVGRWDGGTVGRCQRVDEERFLRRPPPCCVVDEDNTQEKSGVRCGRGSAAGMDGHTYICRLECSYDELTSVGGPAVCLAWQREDKRRRLSCADKMGHLTPRVAIGFGGRPTVPPCQPHRRTRGVPTTTAGCARAATRRAAGTMAGSLA